MPWRLLYTLLQKYLLAVQHTHSTSFVETITMFSMFNTFTAYTSVWGWCQKECMQYNETWKQRMHTIITLWDFFGCLFPAMYTSWYSLIGKLILSTKITTDSNGHMSQLHLLDITLSRPFGFLFWSEGWEFSSQPLIHCRNGLAVSWLKIIRRLCM